METLQGGASPITSCVAITNQATEETDSRLFTRNSSRRRATGHVSVHPHHSRAPAGSSTACVDRPGTSSPGYVLRETRNASVNAPPGYGPSLKSGISWIRGALSRANIPRMHVRQINSNPPSPRSIGISQATRPLPFNPLPFYDVQTTRRSPGLGSSMLGPPAYMRARAISKQLPP